MILEPWSALPAGLLIATMVSTVGLGGGIFWMPFLLLLAGLEPGQAVVTSLLIQTAGMGSSTAAYARQGCVDRKLARRFLLFALPGLAVGASFAHRLDPSLMEMLLGLLVMATALWFVSANQKEADPEGEISGRAGIFRTSCLVGLLAVASGMLSISLGEWLVPVLRNRLGLRMSRAIGTSITVIFGTCVAATAIHYLLGGRADLALVLWGVPGVIIGGQIGPRLATRVNDRLLKEFFIFLLTLIGIHLVYNAF